MDNKQIKSTERVRDLGEVFTHEREVKAMLDRVQEDDLRNQNIDARYLEPACGTGNFLIEILQRKLAHKDLVRYKRQQREWEMNALVAVSSLYGVDIQADNIERCRERLYFEVEQTYLDYFKKKIDEKFLKNILFILSKNMIVGDAREYRDNLGNPIIFSQWQRINNVIHRKDYHFEYLVDGSSEAKLDKEFLPVNYLLLYKQQEL